MGCKWLSIKILEEGNPVYKFKTQYIYDCTLKYADGDRDSEKSHFQMMRNAFLKLHPGEVFPPNNECHFASGELSTCPFFEE